MIDKESIDLLSYEGPRKILLVENIFPDEA